MNKQSVSNITNKYRDSIYIHSAKHHMKAVEFEQWGAGEYKITYDIREVHGRFIHIYIPYATFSTLEKAQVFAQFAEKQGVTVVSTLVGYVSYGRQERETDKEPALLGIMKALLETLPNVEIIDPHSASSLGTFKHLYFSKLMSENVCKESYVIAPDRGASIRNEALSITTHILIDKQRKDGEVESEIAVDFLGGGHDRPIDFIIYDDICDGGRTFLNVAKLVKERYPKCKITLCVAHAILPFGTDHLKEYIDGVVTLNTCFPSGVFDDKYVTALDAIRLFLK